MSAPGRRCPSPVERHRAARTIPGAFHRVVVLQRPSRPAPPGRRLPARRHHRGSGPAGPGPAPHLKHRIGLGGSRPLGSRDRPGGPARPRHRPAPGPIRDGQAAEAAGAGRGLPRPRARRSTRGGASAPAQPREWGCGRDHSARDVRTRRRPDQAGARRTWRSGGASPNPYPGRTVGWGHARPSVRRCAGERYGHKAPARDRCPGPCPRLRWPRRRLRPHRYPEPADERQRGAVWRAFWSWARTARFAACRGRSRW